MDEQAEAILPQLVKVERALGRKAFPDSPEPDESFDFDTLNATTACMVRLVVGSCCELYAAFKARKISSKGAKALTPQDKRDLVRVYSDASLAAAWTSAHAEHAVCVQTFSCAFSTPCIHSVPCDVSEMDVGSLCAHHHSNKFLPPDSATLLSLLTRCSGPGTRGWDAALRQCIEKSEGTKRVCTNSVVVGLTGMHSSIHPCMRMRWQERLALSHGLLPVVNHAQFTSVMHKMAMPTRESVRRMMCRSISSCVATVHARPGAASFATAPLCMPSQHTEASMAAFARAGRLLLADMAQNRPFDVAARVNEAFATQVESEFCPAWRASAVQRGIAVAKNAKPGTCAAADVWSAAFRCNFLAFWAHSHAHSLRAVRLDRVQHESIHGMNAATQLTLLLDDEERMRLHRTAMQTAGAGIFSVEEAAEVLGMHVPPKTDFKTKNALQVTTALRSLGARDGARMLCFLRMASICEDIRIYDLGEKTADLQAGALRRRLLIGELHGPVPDGQKASDFLHLLPDHATKLAVCVECRRVANATSSDYGTSQTFNEIGTTSSMIMEHAERGSSALRCSKRCSASMKSASAFECKMGTVCIECEPVDETAIESLFGSERAEVDSGTAARARRDSKNSLAQRVQSTHCGTEDMLMIPIVGKAVRLWGSWYALCAYCGCFVKFSPHNRHAADICCLRCDHRLLSRGCTAARDREANAAQCRFCAKRDPQRSGLRWRLVRAPLDTSGANAALPPPLRTVFFCPQHFRNWIPSAMKTLPTRVILSHIVFNARPCFGSEGEGDNAAGPPPPQRSGHPKRRAAKRPKLGK